LNPPLSRCVRIGAIITADCGDCPNKLGRAGTCRAHPESIDSWRREAFQGREAFQVREVRLPHVDRRACTRQVVRLPPYSPDFHPVEHAISKVKTMLRALADRTVPELFDGVKDALRTISPADAKAYMEHCGYATKRPKPL
jgi:transposase